MPRLPPVPDDSDDPVLAQVFDHFRDDGRPVPELYRTLGNAPEMLKAWTRFAWPLRGKARSSRGLRELIIMRVAQLTDAEVEWQAHWDMAVEHGVTSEQLAQLADWEDSDAFSDDERLVLRFTDEVTRDVGASAATFDAMRRRFDSDEIVELTLTAAFYSCVSRVLRTLALGPVPGKEHTVEVMRPPEA